MALADATGATNISYAYDAFGATTAAPTEPDGPSDWTGRFLRKAR
jgi:hypothetical protein